MLEGGRVTDGGVERCRLKAECEWDGLSLMISYAGMTHRMIIHNWWCNSQSATPYPCTCMCL
jgi:hypothetical protein